jgi:uncharacterized membrane protein
VLQAELRYAAQFLAILSVFGLSIWLSLMIGRAGHLSALDFTLLTGIFLALAAFVWLMLSFVAWTPPGSGTASQPRRQARVAPIVVNVLIVLVTTSTILQELPVFGGPHRIDGFFVFAIVCFAIIGLGVRAVRDGGRFGRRISAKRVE